MLFNDSFFTKFNYFFMVSAPILIHEYFILTRNLTLGKHWRNFLKNAKLVLSYTLGKALFVYCLAT